ncbi:hypothetical protein [Hydrogenovibrio halophilus]|uniref:hypothetical protein n=1 Tax=Hydrogenovibrio halophilus TaxID=373391 RepID=UPI0003635AAB|nr:hypothetical protein [Hydrogenovibrio halophilus]
MSQLTKKRLAALDRRIVAKKDRRLFVYLTDNPEEEATIAAHNEALQLNWQRGENEPVGDFTARIEADCVEQNPEAILFTIETETRQCEN